MRQTSWETIQIITKTQNISINHYADSSTVEIFHFKTQDKKGLNVANSDTLTKVNFFLTDSEKDSLYSYVFDLITKPFFTDRAATDYAGYVQVKLIDRNTTLSCEYKSVGEWSTVSTTTKKIYNLLKTKIEVAYQ